MKDVRAFGATKPSLGIGPPVRPLIEPYHLGRVLRARYIAERRKLDLDWYNDESRLRHHVLPVIGDMLIANVRTRHIIDLFRRIRTNKERPVAHRTVHSIYSTVAAMFRDAKLADKIEQTPCCLTEKQLGPLVDKDPEWRPTAVFARDEVETIISCPEIPFDRRVCYALELLFGCAHRRGRGEKGTKTESVNHIPGAPDARRNARGVEARRMGRDDGAAIPSRTI